MIPCRLCADPCGTGGKHVFHICGRCRQRVQRGPTSTGCNEQCERRCGRVLGLEGDVVRRRVGNVLLASTGVRYADVT